MARERLGGDEIARVLADWPDDACDLALELREFVLAVAPEADETIAFGSFCYHKPDAPFGRIGGNVCMIGFRDDCLRLGFIHGAALPDPEGLLQGSAKAARYVELRSRRDFRRTALKKLIRASVAYTPTA